MPARVDPRSFLPLTPLAFQVLMALGEGQRHGYGIIVEVKERTEGLITLRTGTLYTMLQRLMAGGLIEESDAPDDSDSDDERRKYYGLTALGVDVLSAEAQRLDTLVADARRMKLIGRKPQAKPR